MNTRIFLAALVALLVGFGGGYALAGSRAQYSMPMSHTMSDGMMNGTSHSGGMQMEMDSMMAGLKGKSGDEFDKAFLSEMIMHHEGAVDMAEAALQYAKHQEIKDMADAIISAQTVEIKQMQDWQRLWYGQ